MESKNVSIHSKFPFYFRSRAEKSTPAKAEKKKFKK